MKKYLVVRNGTEVMVEVEHLREHIFRVGMNGTTHEIDVRQCTADSLSLLMDNAVFDFSYGFADDGIELHSKNGAYRFEVLNERKQLARRARRKRDEERTGGHQGLHAGEDHRGPRRGRGTRSRPAPGS